MYLILHFVEGNRIHLPTAIFAYVRATFRYKGSINLWTFKLQVFRYLPSWGQMCLSISDSQDFDLYEFD